MTAARRRRTSDPGPRPEPVPGADAGLELDDQLCFALYAASRAVTGHYRTLLADLGLTYPQYLVMLVLWEHGEVAVKDLGERLQLDSGTLSPLLSRLDAAGLVTRRRDTRDERSVLVGLTPAGKRMKRKAAGVPARLCAAIGLDDSGRARLNSTLRALTTSVRSAPDHTSS